VIASTRILIISHLMSSLTNVATGWWWLRPWPVIEAHIPNSEQFLFTSTSQPSDWLKKNRFLHQSSKLVTATSYTRKTKQQLQKSTVIQKTKFNETKAWFLCLLHHMPRKWIYHSTRVHTRHTSVVTKHRMPTTEMTKINLQMCSWKKKTQNPRILMTMNPAVSKLVPIVHLFVRT